MGPLGRPCSDVVPSLVIRCRVSRVSSVTSRSRNTEKGFLSIRLARLPPLVMTRPFGFGVAPHVASRRCLPHRFPSPLPVLAGETVPT